MKIATVCSVAFEMSPYNLIEGPGDMTQEVCLSKINNVILQQPAVVFVATANREKTGIAKTVQHIHVYIVHVHLHSSMHAE